MSPLQILSKVAYEKLALPIPSHTIPEMASLMQLCLSDDPTQRPSFATVIEKLEEFKSTFVEERM